MAASRRQRFKSWVGKPPQPQLVLQLIKRVLAIRTVAVELAQGENFAVQRRHQGGVFVASTSRTSLRAKAEQLDAVQHWYRILSEALRKYLRGRQLSRQHASSQVDPASYGANWDANCRPAWRHSRI
jgi:hypothetical protein